MTDARKEEFKVALDVLSEDTSEFAAFCCKLASQRHLDILRIINSFYFPQVSEHILQIVSCIPESVPVLEYSDLVETGLGVKAISRRSSKDWENSELRIPDTLPALFKPYVRQNLFQFRDTTYEPIEPIMEGTDELESLEYPPEPTTAISWAVKRIHDIDEKTGMIGNALDFAELCNTCIPSSKEIEELFLDSQICAYAAYERKPPVDIGLKTFNEMKDEDKLEVFLSGLDAEQFILAIEGLALPIIKRNTKAFAAFLDNQASNNIDVFAAFMDWYTINKNTTGVVLKDTELEKIMLKTFRNCASNSKWRLMKDLQAKMTTNSETNALMKKVIGIGTTLDSDFGTRKTFSFVESLSTNKDNFIELAGTVSDNAQARQFSDVKWKAALDFFDSLMKSSAPKSLNKEEVATICFKRLVEAQRFLLAKTIIYDVKEPEQIILNSERAFLSRRKDLKDADVTKAMDFITIIPDTFKDKAPEKNFLDALRVLVAEKLTSISPDAVRSALYSDKRIEFISQLVNDCAPKSAIRLLDITQRVLSPLGITLTAEETNKLNLAVGNSMVAAQMDPRDICPYCLNLILADYTPAVPLIQQVLGMKKLPDKYKETMLSFCMTHNTDVDPAESIKSWQKLVIPSAKLPPPDDKRQVLLHVALMAPHISIRESVSIPLTILRPSIDNISREDITECLTSFAGVTLECQRVGVLFLRCFRRQHMIDSPEPKIKSIDEVLNWEGDSETFGKYAELAAEVKRILVCSNVYSEISGKLRIHDISASRFAEYSPAYRTAKFCALIKEPYPADVIKRLQELSKRCGVNSDSVSFDTVSAVFTKPKVTVEEIQNTKSAHEESLNRDPSTAILVLLDAQKRIAGTNLAILKEFYALLGSLKKRITTDAFKDNVIVETALKRVDLVDFLSCNFTGADLSSILDPANEVAAQLQPLVTDSTMDLIPVLVQKVCVCRNQKNDVDTVLSSLMAGEIRKKLLRFMNVSFTNEADLESKATEMETVYNDLCKPKFVFLTPTDLTAVAILIVTACCSYASVKLDVCKHAVESWKSVPEDLVASSPIIDKLNKEMDTVKLVVNMSERVPESLKHKYVVVTLQNKKEAKEAAFVSFCDELVHQKDFNNINILYDFGKALEWPASMKEVAGLAGSLLEGNLPLKPGVSLPSIIPQLVNSVFSQETRAHTDFFEFCSESLLRSAATFIKDEYAPIQGRSELLDLLHSTLDTESSPTEFSKCGVSFVPLDIEVYSNTGKLWPNFTIDTLPTPKVWGTANAEAVDVNKFIETMLHGESLTPNHLITLQQVLGLYQKRCSEEDSSLYSESWKALFKAMIDSGMQIKVVEFLSKNSKVLNSVDMIAVKQSLTGKAARMFSDKFDTDNAVNSSQQSELQSQDSEESSFNKEACQRALASNPPQFNDITLPADGVAMAQIIAGLSGRPDSALDKLARDTAKFLRDKGEFVSATELLTEFYHLPVMFRSTSAMSPLLKSFLADDDS